LLVQRFISEFEERQAPSDERHHEQNQSTQKKFLEQVTALKAVFEDMGNPFMEESEDLYTLDSRIIMSQAVVKTVQGIQKFGGAQYNDFVKKSSSGFYTHH